MTTTDRQGTFEQGRSVFKALLTGCAKVLDLGCGERYYSKDAAYPVWVDLKPRDPKVICADILECPQFFRRMHFDAVILIDTIEHVAKPAGVALLKQLESITDRIILFTPLGELWATPGSDDPDTHQCGWMPDELQDYEVWLWPRYHKFEASTHGAFFAWKWMNGKSPTPDAVSCLSGVSL